MRLSVPFLTVFICFLWGNGYAGQIGVTPYLREAEKALANKDYSAALSCYRKLIENNYQPGHSNLVTGELCVLLQEHKEAGEYFRRALEYRLSKKDMVRAHLGLGKVYYQQQDFAKAIEHFRECIVRMQKHEEAHLGLSLVYRDMGMYAEALTEITACKKNRKYRYEYNLISGQILKEWGIYPKAVAHLQQALLLRPSSSEVHELLEEIYYAQREYQKAVAELEILVAVEPRADCYRMLALSFFYLQDREKALSFLQQASRIEPNDYLNYAVGGLIYSGLAEWKKAEEQFACGLELEPSSGLCLLGKGWSQLHLQERGAAKKTFEHVKDLKNMNWLQEIAEKNLNSFVEVR